MKAIAIVLAAGESRRMGHPKALLEAKPGVSFVELLARTFEEAGLSTLLVVGAHSGEIRAVHPTLSSVLNPHWSSGQWSSVRVGLRAALAQGAERLLIQPVDVPLISPLTASRVLEALTRSPAVIPIFGGEPGHPLGLRASAARAVLESSAATLADAVGLLAAQFLAVEDPAVLDNLNSPESYRHRFGHAVAFVRPPPG